MSRKVPEEFGIKRKKVRVFPLTIFILLTLTLVLYVLTKPRVAVKENVTLRGVIYIKSFKSYISFKELHEVKVSTGVVIPIRDVCYMIRGNFTLLTGNVKKVDSMVCWKPSQRSVFFKYSKSVSVSFVNITKKEGNLRVSITNPSDYAMEATVIVRDFGNGKSELRLNNKKVSEFTRDYQYEISVRSGETLTLELRQKS